MHRIVCTLVVLIGICLGQASDSFIGTVEHVKHAVIPVACSTWPDKDGQVDIQQILGTGLFVSFEGHFVTAAHVLDKPFRWSRQTGAPVGECFPVIYVPNPTWEHPKWFVFRDCTIDDAADLAVCKTSLNPFGIGEIHPSRLHLRAIEPADATDVAFTGFPQSITVPVTSRATVASIGQFLIPNHDPKRYVLIDKTCWHGVSGGPLYLSDGSVIAVMAKAGEDLWSGMAFAITSAQVVTFLRQHNIPIWEEDGEQKNSVPEKH